MSNSLTYALAVLAGGAAALGHAPFGLWPVALVGFAGLIWLVSRGARPGWIGWFGGVGYFALVLHWIVEPFLVDIQTHGWMAPFALVLLAGGLALFWGIAALGGDYFGHTRGRRALAFAATLGFAEMVRGHIFTGFPWALPAYIWADTPVRLIAAYGGSYGLTVLTLLGAALPSMLRQRGISIAASIVLFLVLFAAGWSDLKSYDNAETSSLGTVRLVQPNVPQHEKWDREKIPEHFTRMLDLTRSGAQTPIDLVVWPEVAIVYPLDRAGVALAEGRQAVSDGATPETRLITGINRRDAEDNWYNALVVLGPDAVVEETYDKVHLVPFGEYIPFKIEVLRAMAATAGFGFTSGETVRAIDTPLGRAIPLICYEGIFPRHIFLAEERPDYLLQITNDAWFGTFSGPYQHLDQARFRAVEQGLSLVRAANTGVSTVIDPVGTVSEHLRLGQPGVLDQPVPTARPATLYSQIGDFPVIVILLFIMNALFVTRRRNAIAIGRTKS